MKNIVNKRFCFQFWKTMVVVFLVLFSCKSQKIDNKEERKTEIEGQQETSKKQEVSGSLVNRFKSYHFENEFLNYDFSLESQDASHPARLTEWRNGKPYRTLVAENANYSENKSQKARTKSQEIKDYTADFSALKTAFTSQNTKIIQLNKKIEKLKIDNLKIANNIKYLLWLLLAFAGIWIAERSGLFRLIKRFLNGL